MRKYSHSITSDVGYTIIEVLIVLGIAALILVIVLIAAPQLMRTFRDNERRHTASLLLANLLSTQNNTTGSLNFPRDDQEPALCNLMLAATNEFVGNIPSCTPIFTFNDDKAPCIVGKSDRGNNVCMMKQGSSGRGDHDVDGTNGHNYPGNVDEYIVQVGHWCVRPGAPIDPSDDPAVAVVTSETADSRNIFRIISVRTKLESGSNFCVDSAEFAAEK